MIKKTVYNIAIDRRTIHNFNPDPVPHDLIQLAVEAALRSPNHKMTAPWAFVEIGHSLREELGEIFIRAKNDATGREMSEEKEAFARAKFKNIPLLIASVQKLIGDKVRQEEDYASCACGIQNFSLVMWENDYGVKWSTGAVIEHPETYALLGLDPSIERIVGLLWVGVPEIVPATNRPSFEEVYRVAE